MSIGNPIEEKKGNINLTQLARNKRKREDTTTGRKKPRKLDYDYVTPAPDSKLAEMSQMSIKSEVTNKTTELAEVLGDSSPTKSILKTPTTKHKKKDVTFKENLIYSSIPKDKVNSYAWI